MTDDERPARPQHPALAAHRARRRESMALLSADAITAFAGSMRFVALHVVWFAAWVLLNLVGAGIRPRSPSVC